jgi:hypothetical protein
MSHKVGKVITDFKCCFWLYDSSKLLEVINLMTYEDKELFFCDVRRINWNEEGRNLIHGIQRYYIKEDVPSLDSGLHQIMRTN